MDYYYIEWTITVLMYLHVDFQKGSFKCLLACWWDHLVPGIMEQPLHAKKRTYEQHGVLGGRKKIWCSFTLPCVPPLHLGVGTPWQSEGRCACIPTYNLQTHYVVPPPE